MHCHLLATGYCRPLTQPSSATSLKAQQWKFDALCDSLSHHQYAKLCETRLTMVGKAEAFSIPACNVLLSWTNGSFVASTIACNSNIYHNVSSSYISGIPSTRPRHFACYTRPTRCLCCKHFNAPLFFSSQSPAPLPLIASIYPLIQPSFSASFPATCWYVFRPYSLLFL